MRKLLFAILIGLCLSINASAAQYVVHHPQTDTVVNETDTSRWIPLPSNIDSVILLAQGKGGAANDSIIGYLDLCGGDESVDTTDTSYQVWSHEVSVSVDVDDGTVNGTGAYGCEIAGFKYYRLIRYSNTATVAGRIWVLFIKNFRD